MPMAAGGRGEVDVWLYSGLTSAVSGGGWSASRPGRLHPGKRATVLNVEEGEWSPRLVWRVMEERQCYPKGFEPLTL